MIGPGTHLFVATPCYGGMVHQRYMQSAAGLLQGGPLMGFRVSLELLGHESLVTRGRNSLVAKFLDDPTATHLLFIDADIAFETTQVVRMLRFGEDVVAGLYPLKGLEPDGSLRYVGAPCEGGDAESRDGFLTGLYAGTGFLMIRRAALERLAAAHPELRYRAAHTQRVPSASPNQHALFDCMIDPDTGDYLSEDYAFCKRWRALGGKLWLDTQSSLTHIGTHEFEGRPFATMRE